MIYGKRENRSKIRLDLYDCLISQQKRPRENNFTLCLELRSGQVMNILLRSGPSSMHKKVHQVNY